MAMRVISLGWGVQSFGLVAMSALGVLPPVDAAIHANTTHERCKTYEFAAKWTPWLEKHGVRVVTVTGGRRLMGMLPDGDPYTSIPAYTAYSDDVWGDVGDWIWGPDGEETFEPSGARTLMHTKGEPSGMLRRQCTYDWKIAPMRRWLQANRNSQTVEQWIGISLDELERSRLSNVKYITHIYPYLNLPGDYFPQPMRRSDIVRWLLESGLEVPVKSCCVFCPYHDRAAWREIQLSGNGDWEKALMADEVIRHRRPGYTCYLTSKRKPLAECDFRSQEEHGQLTLWEAEECSGNCFL